MNFGRTNPEPAMLAVQSGVTRLQASDVYAGGPHAVRIRSKRALAVTGQKWIDPASHPLARGYRSAGVKQYSTNFLLHHAIRNPSHTPCQTKKSINFICHIMDSDWYKTQVGKIF